MEDGGHLGDDGVEVQQRGREDLLAAEGQELPGELGGAAGGRLDDLHALALGIVRSQLEEQQLAVAHDDGQEIVEVVSDGAGQASHGLHLLKMPHLLFAAMQRFCHAPARDALCDLAGRGGDVAEVRDVEWTGGEDGRHALHPPVDQERHATLAVDVAKAIDRVAPECVHRTVSIVRRSNILSSSNVGACCK